MRSKVSAMAELTSHEREVLEMVAGTRPWAAWDAWLGVCLEYLRDSGFITNYIGAGPKLTEVGRAALAKEAEANG